MAFKSLKNHITSLATPYITDMASNFIDGKQSAQSAGKAIKHKFGKSPFDLQESPQEKLKANPLTFTPVQYPLDLGSNELGHYILFESGYIGYEPQEATTFTHGGEASLRNPNAKGNSFGDKVKKAIQKNKALKNKEFNLKTPDGNVPRKGDKTITTSAVSIYMPPNIKVSYSQTYENEDLGMVGDIEAGLKKVMDAESALESMQVGFQGTVGPLFREGKKIIGEAAGAMGLGDPVRMMAKRGGIALNPRAEQFYSAPNFRNFTYEFDFHPRNQKEAESVQKIIDIMKYNSAPGLGAGFGSIFSIPNYFRISYMFNGQQNKFLHGIAAAYLTSVNVDYTPDGQVSTFGNGMPTHIKMSLEFTEDRLLTKRDIIKGA